MKKILSILMLCALSWVAVAQTTLTKPQSMKALMAKEHLRNTLQAKKQPAAAKAPTQLADLDTTEVYFTSFLDEDNPYFYEPNNWYFTVQNERYKFIFSIIKDNNPQSMAGTYTEKDLEEDASWCMFPEANGDTHYYKTCQMTITEETLSASTINYIVDAVVLATCGIGGPEYGYFKIHAEHQVTKAIANYDVAILNCVVTEEEDRIRIAGQDDTIAVDLTFFTELGVEGYYSHKIMDTENSHIVHRGVAHEIAKLEGVIVPTETMNGGMAYLFMFEAMTTDAVFYNVAMEAPVVAKDTIEIKCNNMTINDAFGISHSTIEISAANEQYDVYAGYIDTKVTTPQEYKDGTSHVFLTDLKTDQEIESIMCNLKITGNKLQGYKVEIKMLGSDYKQYNIHLVYEEPKAKETKTLDFKNNSKTMFYIDNLGLKELQMANFDGEYSVSFDILRINQVMDGEFDMTNMFEEQTFLIHHINDNGDEYDSPVRFAKFGGKIWQENDTTFLTASILGFDSIQYEISMFYAVPTPKHTVTYTFDGLAYEEAAKLTNAVTSAGIFILDGMSDDGKLMAKVNVERITNKSIEGTFYNDGKFDHNDFYPIDTWVKVWNTATKKYEEFSVEKGTMTVKVENGIVTAVASFICNNAVQYDLTFKTKYTREQIPFDEEEEELDYTFAADSHVMVIDWRPYGYRIIELFMVDADETIVADFYFIADQDVVADSEIIIPAGVYPINASWKSGTVLACSGILPDGPAQSYVCWIDKEGNLDPDGLYCLVDGTATIQNVNGKMKVEVDAINSYDVPVKLHYEGSIVVSVENVDAEKNTDTKASKRLVNGQLLIIRNGKTYNATGALVK